MAVQQTGYRKVGGADCRVSMNFGPGGASRVKVLDALRELHLAVFEEFEPDDLLTIHVEADGDAVAIGFAARADERAVAVVPFVDHSADYPRNK